MGGCWVRPSPGVAVSASPGPRRLPLSRTTRSPPRTSTHRGSTRSCYFGQDDWATGEAVSPWWDAYLDAYARIDQRGAAIFVVSKELADRMSSRATVVPNGVNPEIWPPHHTWPARIDKLPRPRAIYSGTINDRLEISLVERTAEAVGSLIMIGHFGDESVVRWLRGIENVHVFGTVGQIELAATVQACDLGVIRIVTKPVSSDVSTQAVRISCCRPSGSHR